MSSADYEMYRKTVAEYGLCFACDHGLDVFEAFAGYVVAFFIDEFTGNGTNRVCDLGNVLRFKGDLVFVFCANHCDHAAGSACNSLVHSSIAACYGFVEVGLGGEVSRASLGEIAPGA